MHEELVEKIVEELDDHLVHLEELLAYLEHNPGLLRLASASTGAAVELGRDFLESLRDLSEEIQDSDGEEADYD